MPWNSFSECSRWVRSRITFWARSEAFHSAGFSASAFSSSRRRVAASTSKMPPQQGQRLSDLVGHRFDFGAHCSSSSQLGHPPAPRRRGCSCLTLYPFGGVSYRPSPTCCHPRQASVREREPGPFRPLREEKRRVGQEGGK